MNQKDLTKKFEKLNKQLDQIAVYNEEVDGLIYRRLKEYHEFVGYEGDEQKITITSSFPVKGGYFVIYNIKYSDHEIEDMYSFFNIESLFMTKEEYISIL